MSGTGKKSLWNEERYKSLVVAFADIIGDVSTDQKNATVKKMEDQGHHCTWEAIRKHLQKLRKNGTPTANKKAVSTPRSNSAKTTGGSTGSKRKRAGMKANPIAVDDDDSNSGLDDDDNEEGDFKVEATPSKRPRRAAPKAFFAPEPENPRLSESRNNFNAFHCPEMSYKHQRKLQDEREKVRSPPPAAPEPPLNLRSARWAKIPFTNRRGQHDLNPTKE